MSNETALRTGSLQGAYFIIAARALGLDAGPMSGFDNAMVDKTFFAGTSWKSNFLCNVGYGVLPTSLFSAWAAVKESLQDRLTVVPWQLKTGT